MSSDALKGTVNRSGFDGLTKSHTNDPALRSTFSRITIADTGRDTRRER
jgi:hypothetical protein